LGDVCGEIAEADNTGEVGPTHLGAPQAPRTGHRRAVPASR
jgi:hypothetical protein